MNIAICLKPGDSASERDKFLILSMKVDEKVNSLSGLTDEWNLADESAVVEHRIHCIMNQASTTDVTSQSPLDVQVHVTSLGREVKGYYT